MNSDSAGAPATPISTPTGAPADDVLITVPATIVAAGSGRMGCSMAVAFAYAGMPITLLDLKPRDAGQLAIHRDGVWQEINGHLETLNRIGVIGSSDIDRIAGRISFVGYDDHAALLARADMVLEGVPERIDDKRAAFALIEACVPRACILASTTSSFLSTELAQALQYSDRFLNAHWLNPAYIIPLVELSPHAQTSAQTTQRMQAVLEKIGKQSVVCAPSPGYIVPRLQALVMSEAARMVEEGVASAKEIDRAVRLGFGMRYAAMGVLEFVDFGGLDILYYAGRYMAKTVDEQRYATPALVERLMQEGKLGVRTGQGLYDWSEINVPEYRDQIVSRLADSLRREGLLKPPAGD